MRVVLLALTALLLAACGQSPVNQNEMAVSPQEPKIEDLPKSPSSFSKAKALLYEEVHKGHKSTFYCGCKFTSTKRVYLGTCDVEPRKNEDRAKRLEAEHVFPASHFGQHRACWNQKLCTDNKGKAYGGRRCCERIDPVFEAAHNDLHNLQPSVGELNGDRSNRPYGMIEGEQRAYGACDFEVDFQMDVAEPGDQVKGDIARTYLYMRDTYGINLSSQQTKLFNAWHKQDPVDDWERERNARIEKIQGVGNKYIESE